MEGLSRRSNATAAILKVMGLFSGVQIVTILCSMVRTKLVALWIGAEGVGLFGIFNSAIDMLGALTTLGIATSSVRSLAAVPEADKPEMARVVLRWGLILGLVGALVIACGAPLLSRSSFGNGQWTAAFALLAVCMIFNASTGANRAVMQGLGSYKALARSTIAGAVAGIVVSAPLFYFLGVRSIVPALIGFSAVAYFATRYYRPGLAGSISVTRSVLMSKGKEFLRLGAYMTVTSTAAYLVSYIFLSWLNRRADVDTVGYYQAGFTLFNRYAGLIFTAIAVEYYPRLSSVAGKRRSMSVMVNHEATLLMWMLLAIVPAFILCVPLMIRVLYTEAFLEMAPFVTLGIVGTVLRGLSWCMSFTILARGDGKLFLVTELLSSAVCLALNILGYQLGGLAGLGVSYILWYAAYTLIVAIVYYRFYHMSIDRRVWGHCVIVLGVSGAAAVLALATPWWWLNIGVTLLSVSVAAARLRKLYRR